MKPKALVLAVTCSVRVPVPTPTVHSKSFTKKLTFTISSLKMYGTVMYGMEQLQPS